jgi:uncharacterized protein (DUF2249 family)
VSHVASGSPPPAEDPTPPPGSPHRRLDVRPVLASGDEPFELIMREIGALGPGEALALVSPFDPAPLHRVLAGRGFARRTVRHAGENWETLYWRDATAGRGAPEPSPRPPAEVELDVRGLRPPEPLERTLAALERLPAGGRLVQVNDRVPVFLLPLLEERGFGYRIGADDRGTLVAIWREPAG